MPKLIKESEIKKWKNLHDKGWSINELAKKFHVFGGTISKYIKEYEAKLAAKEAAKSGTVGETAKSPEEETQEEEYPASPWKRGKKKSEGEGGKVAQSTGRLDEDERIEAKKSLRFDPDLLKIAEWTVAQGLAKDLSSAIRAWGKDYYYRHSDVLDNPEGDIMPKKQGNDLGKDIDFSDVIRLMKQRVAMDTMATLAGEKSGGIDINKLIALSFLERQYKGGDGTGVNPQIQALQNEIKSLKDAQMQQAQLQKFESMFQNLQNQIQVMAQNKGGDWKDILALTEKSKADLERIRAEHENRLEQQRAKTEAAREEANKIRFEQLQNEVKNQMQHAAEAYKWKDEISRKYMDQAMKILDEQYKRGAKEVAGEKSTAELAKDFVTDFVEKIRTPILEPMGKAMAHKIAQQPQGLTPQQQAVIKEAQERYKQKQQQLVKEAELKRSEDLMD